MRLLRYKGDAMHLETEAIVPVEGEFIVLQEVENGYLVDVAEMADVTDEGMAEPTYAILREDCETQPREVIEL